MFIKYEKGSTRELWKMVHGLYILCVNQMITYSHRLFLMQTISVHRLLLPLHVALKSVKTCINHPVKTKTMFNNIDNSADPKSN